MTHSQQYRRSEIVIDGSSYFEELTRNAAIGYEAVKPAVEVPDYLINSRLNAVCLRNVDAICTAWTSTGFESAMYRTWDNT